ncbi:hypothetical protein CN13_06805 [Petrotoga sp. HKA.pet.4.5]|uniref:tetratricopeptide repeat protein n=1 Tax=unclassified Petrotoga TaxID=2620614 RepID=UPI000EF14406|nr:MULTISPECIES: tetratricopeptide repeat protein [unclassified Petrotoga]RLL85324.1 hypothetical protein BZ25_03190 [Petrotoga sp. Shatin.DS.tank11.9.2.9.3]RLL88927.1 hypothetical protein CN13_06805 [Petrotoga sp. HKA.pet.4.5]
MIDNSKGDLDNPLKYLQEALKIDQEIGYKQGEAKVLDNIGLILKSKGDLENALKYLKDAINIMDKYKFIHGRNVIQKAINSITNDLERKLTKKPKK